MNQNWKRCTSLIGLGTVTALSLLATPAPAQGPGGQPPDAMGRPPMDRPMDGGPMPGGSMPGGRPPFGGPRPATLADVPLSALAAGLDLKGDQQDKITKLKQQARAKRQSTQGAARTAMRSAALASESQATDDIQAVLSDSQKKSLPALLQTFSALRAAGVPLILYADLKLTAAQSKQIAALAPSDTTANAGRDARQQARDKVTALLTDTQKEMVEEARDEARMLGGPPPFMPGGRPMGQGRGGGRGANGRGGPSDGGGPGGDRMGGPPSDGGPGGPMGGPPPDGGGPDGPPPDGGPGGPMGGPPPDGF